MRLRRTVPRSRRGARSQARGERSPIEESQRSSDSRSAFGQNFGAPNRASWSCASQSAHALRATQEPQLRSAHENSRPNRGTTRNPKSIPSRSIMLSIFGAVGHPGRPEEIIATSFVVPARVPSPGPAHVSLIWRKGSCLETGRAIPATPTQPRSGSTPHPGADPSSQSRAACDFRRGPIRIAAEDEKSPINVDLMVGAVGIEPTTSPV